jgi:hypothetical protein
MRTLIERLDSNYLSKARGTDAERLALATGAATYRWEDPSKAPVNAEAEQQLAKQQSALEQQAASSGAAQAAQAQAAQSPYCPTPLTPCPFPTFPRFVAGSPFTAAQGINPQGDIVGLYYDSS